MLNHFEMLTIVKEAAAHATSLSKRDQTDRPPWRWPVSMRTKRFAPDFPRMPVRENMLLMWPITVFSSPSSSTAGLLRSPFSSARRRASASSPGVTRIVDMFLMP